jgi:uncharacterized membrane protein YhfC
MDIIARVLNFTLMFAMPIGLAIYLVRRYKTHWSTFGIGVMTLILSQVGHIPFNLLVLNPVVDQWGLDNQVLMDLVVYGLLYGLSAGLFEEVTRYLGYRLWIKRERNWESAVMYGAGHGGIESIIIGGIVLYGFIQAIALRNVDLVTMIDPEQLETARAQLAAYWAAPWHLAILGAVERFATILFHLSASVLVLQSFTRKNILWIILAVFWHTLLDAVSVIASQTWNPYVTEAIILVMGLLSLGIVLKLKPPRETNREKDELDEGMQLNGNERLSKPIPPSEESLDDSRYV